MARKSSQKSAAITANIGFEADPVDGMVALPRKLFALMEKPNVAVAA